MLGSFLVGWAIYPIRIYGMVRMDGTTVLEMELPSMEVIYNIGDAINKIGFGLVVYTLAVNSSND